MNGKEFEHLWGENCYQCMVRMNRKIDLLEHDLGLRERRVVELETQLAELSKRVGALERGHACLR